jgi:hypothetical protein
MQHRRNTKNALQRRGRVNAERLKRLVSLMRSVDSDWNISGILAQLRAALDQLSSQPNQPTYQNEVAKRLAELKETLEAVDETLTPAQHERLSEIGGARFFTREMSEAIRLSLAENAMTPAVARDRVAQLEAERSNFLITLQEAERSTVPGNRLALTCVNLPDGEEGAVTDLR